MPNIIIDRSNIKANGFCIIPRPITLDASITPEAVGLYVKIYTFDEDKWELSIHGLAKTKDSAGVTNAGKEKIMRILNELIDHGYITRRKDRNQGGQFGGYVYEIHETPQTEETEVPEIEAQGKRKAKADVKHKHGEYSHVRLTDGDYERLVDEYGDAVTERAIQAVDEYCETNGKTYKNYYLAIRKWGIDAARNKARKAVSRPSGTSSNPFAEMLQEGGF